MLPSRTGKRGCNSLPFRTRRKSVYSRLMMCKAFLRVLPTAAVLFVAALCFVQSAASHQGVQPNGVPTQMQASAPAAASPEETEVW